MQEELGHKMSEQTIQLALQHLAKSAKHARQVEEQGQAVEGQSKSGIQAGQLIRKHVQAMQQHLVAAKELANELEHTKSTKVYAQMELEHNKARQEHTEATKEFLKYLNPVKHWRKVTRVG